MNSIQPLCNVLEAFLIEHSLNQKRTWSRAKLHDLEMETKYTIHSTHDIERVLNDVAHATILFMEHRSERHDLRRNENGTSACIIRVQYPNPEVWVKIKSKNMPAIGMIHGIPFVTRHAKKYKPDDPAYANILADAFSASPIASFTKECYNIFFEWNAIVYSLSFSLAYNRASFYHTQMEFEYEGCLKEDARSFSEIMNEFERMLVSLFSDWVQGLHTETKQEALESFLASS